MLKIKLFLLLARHGNTFESQEKPFWVGKDQDLPLTSFGRSQGETLGNWLQQYLEANSLHLPYILAGPLKRTREYAKLLKTSSPIKIHSALEEIDYGPWGGKTEEEIQESLEKNKQSETIFSDWVKFSKWPHSIFPQQEKEVEAQIEQLIQEILLELEQGKFEKDLLVPLISSNGKLRYFLKFLFPEEWKRWQEEGKGRFKVKTGNICLLRFEEGKWFLDLWDHKIKV